MKNMIYHQMKNEEIFEKKASCTEFGQLCPAYFVSEPLTETSIERNKNRNIPHATIIRVLLEIEIPVNVAGRYYLIAK